MLHFQKFHKIAVLGCSGSVGLPLSLLLKRNSNISHLSLYDIKEAMTVAVDLSQVDTSAYVTGEYWYNFVSQNVLCGIQQR